MSLRQTLLNEKGNRIYIYHMWHKNPKSSWGSTLLPWTIRTRIEPIIRKLTAPQRRRRRDCTNHKAESTSHCCSFYLFRIRQNIGRPLKVTEHWLPRLIRLNKLTIVLIHTCYCVCCLEAKEWKWIQGNSFFFAKLAYKTEIVIIYKIADTEAALS